MKFTEEQISYIVSFMLSAARRELSSHVWYKHDEYPRTAPSGYFRSTYKYLDLEWDDDVLLAMCKALSKHLKDNEELLMMYGRIDEEDETMNPKLPTHEDLGFTAEEDNR